MTKEKKPTIFNYLLPLLMIGLGLRHWAKHGMDLIVIIPIVLGLFALYMTLFNQPLLHRVESFIIKAWYPVGQLITVILLGVTFYLVFAPVGLLLRFLKKDILNRNRKDDRLSYWIDRQPKEENNYTQQF